MPRTKMIDGVIIPLTQEEETARDAEELAYANAKPMEDWKADMHRSDTELLPRYAEDILDGMPNKLSVAKITLDRLQAKKDLRATKP
jgi:hypothetical protein